jgi:NADP-dependent 3-hydroxy acid dehydrogenase YdfG
VTVSEPGKQIAVVTGASGGIGRAVAAALAERGMSPCLAGRDRERLRRLADALATRGARPSVVAADLRTDDGIRELVASVESLGRVDVLCHCAGALRLGDIMSAGWDDLDELYRVNVRAPYLVTKALLPLLVASRGQIVFVNSSAALKAGDTNGAYAATKAALMSLTGSIRDRVNPLGVRVLSVFPGRTATAMQEQVIAFEGSHYDAANFLQPSDVAEVVVHALLMPRSAEVTDVMVRPMNKASGPRRSP